MQDLKLQFLNNSYPEKLIDDKIREISGRKFLPRQRDIKYSEINSDQKYTIVLPYTSFRCSSVEFKMLNLIKSVTPDYHMNFAWTLIKIGRTITPRLKPVNPEKIGLCYKFTCDCDKLYIGETGLTLADRVDGHAGRDKKSTVFEHIEICDEYLNTYYRLPGRKPSDFQFLLKHFRILACNLDENDRKTYEAIEIAKYSSSRLLNKQESFDRKLKLL